MKETIQETLTAILKGKVVKCVILSKDEKHLEIMFEDYSTFRFTNSWCQSQGWEELERERYENLVAK